MTTTAPKRHHYVPACYLRAWADGEDTALIRRRDAERPFLTNVGNVASESGFYGRGADATAREKMFGTVERDWPWLRERMTDDCHLADSERELVAIFISLQFTRTRESFARREFVAAIAAYSQERPLSRETVHRYLAERHLGFAPEDAEVEGAWTLANSWHALLPTRQPGSTDRGIADVGGRSGRPDRGRLVVSAADVDRLARAYLLHARIPGDPAVTELVTQHGPAVTAQHMQGYSRGDLVELEGDDG